MSFSRSPLDWTAATCGWRCPVYFFDFTPGEVVIIILLSILILWGLAEAIGS